MREVIEPKQMGSDELLENGAALGCDESSTIEPTMVGGRIQAGIRTIPCLNNSDTQKKMM